MDNNLNAVNDFEVDQDRGDDEPVSNQVIEKNTKRAQRRFHDAVAIARQVKIAQTHGVAASAIHKQELGRFRKRHALDCGTPNCPACSSSRRNPSVSGLAKLTRQEQIAVLSMKSEVESAFEPEAPTSGPEAA